MLETISEEDVDRLRVVFRVLFVTSLVANIILASYSSFRAWETWEGARELGYLLLAILLWTSSVFQVLFERACRRETALEIFQQPCLMRWISFAVTFPMQIVVCAWYADVRDTYVLLLIVVAAVVCALLGFVMEQAWTSQDLEEPLIQRADPMSLGVGTVVRGPQADPLLILTQRQKAIASWLVCMLCVAAIHGVTWFVLVGSVRVLQNKSAKQNTRLDEMVDVQCAIMTVIWLVPALQVLVWWLGVSSVEEGLVACSLAYAALDTAAKVQLGVAYAVM